MKQGTVLISLRIAADLLSRTKAIGRQLDMSTKDIVQLGLYDKVDFYEAKLRAQAEQKRADRAQRRTLRTLGELGESPLAPSAPIAPSSPNDNKVAIETDPMTPLYEAHAKKIAEHLEDPIEKRLCIEEALTAIKKAAPLTHPSDKEILTRLEVIVLKQPTITTNTTPAAASNTANTTELRGFSERLSRFTSALINQPLPVDQEKTTIGKAMHRFVDALTEDEK
ncbi:MAG: hypothetical protein UY96_C0003G0103 [Parcubacteria group bacterium GW2011_GWB1_56_8]|nr:MAG: hypothetical protein UY96_C0003G0103 [Parcubacteria group bacterium GW2011_GWB1_56_8]